MEDSVGKAEYAASKPTSSKQSVAGGYEDLTQAERSDGPVGSAGEDTLSEERKIIYSSDVHLVLKKTGFEEFDQEVRKLLDKHEGYHTLVSFEGNQGRERSGRWVLRVPVRHYQSFLGAVKNLGVPELVQETARDVTDEYVDLDARLSNQRRLEARILGVLDEVTGKIGEVLEVERELSRTRETIERLEGKMRQLKDQVSMTTVKLFVREDADYQPPQALSFGEEMGEAWGDSITGIKTFFRELTLAVIALSPWLVMLAGLLFLLRRLIRRFFAKRK